MFYDRIVQVGVFPIGIKPPKSIQGLEKPEVKARIAFLAQQYRDRKTIIGVDRIDYIKGIPQKLHALESSLDKHTEWIGKLAMIQAPIPSREDVKESRDLASSLHQKVDRINQKYDKDCPHSIEGSEKRDICRRQPFSGYNSYTLVISLHCSVPLDELIHSTPHLAFALSPRYETG